MRGTRVPPEGAEAGLTSGIRLRDDSTMSGLTHSNRCRVFAFSLLALAVLALVAAGILGFAAPVILPAQAGSR